MGKHTREYRVWDENEEAALKAGVKKHGLGAWEIIRNDPEFEVLLGRTGVQLKDKWRNLIKFRHISLDDKELFHCKATGNRADRQPRTSARSSFIQYGSHAQDSQPGNEGRSVTPSDSAAYGDRASQKSLFRSSSRRRKSALAADFIMDVDDEDAEELPDTVPARAIKRHALPPGEDRRFGIYDKRRYKAGTGQGSASDVSDSGCLIKGSSDSYTVKCPCGATCDDGEQMIECESCQAWAHTACLRNLMVEYPSLYSFDFSCYHCPYCQSDNEQRVKKRRSMSPLTSVVSQSSEQDSRDSLSVFTTDCKSGIADGPQRSLPVAVKMNPDSSDLPCSMVMLTAAVEVPRAAQKCRSRRGVKRKSGNSWCSWLLPEIRPGPVNPYRCPGTKPLESPFSAFAAQQPSSSSKACNQLDSAGRRDGSLHQGNVGTNQRLGLQRAGASHVLQIDTQLGSKLTECEASPASVKTCDTAEFKVPVSVLCGDVALRNSVLMLPDESDDEDGAVSSSHEHSTEQQTEARSEDGAHQSVLGSQCEQELLAAAALELQNERFSADFVSRCIPTPPLNPSLLPFNLDLPLPPGLGLAPLPAMPDMHLPHPHANAPLPQHPPLFNLSPSASLAAAVGKLEAEAGMLSHLPWMQALFGQPAWPLGLSNAAAAAAAACAAVGMSPAVELYKQGLTGLAMTNMPQPALKLEPLSLDSGAKLQPLPTHQDTSYNNSLSSTVGGPSSVNKSAIDQADAMLLPLLAELRSQTPDPTSFLTPTPIPEMSLPLPYSGACPLFDLPPGMLPLCKTPPLPDGLLNMPSLGGPFPGSTFDANRPRADDFSTAAFDFLHEFVNPDAVDDPGALQLKDSSVRL